MLQLRSKGSSGRFYSPDRDIMNALPRLISRAITDAGHVESEAMGEVALMLRNHFKLAYDPALTNQDVLKAHMAAAGRIGEEEYNAFLHAFLLVVLDFHIAARRQVPTEEAEKDRDERILLEYHNFILQYQRWPFWRKWLYRFKAWRNSLTTLEPDDLTRPLQE